MNLVTRYANKTTYSAWMRKSWLASSTQNNLAVHSYSRVYDVQSNIYPFQRTKNRLTNINRNEGPNSGTSLIWAHRMESVFLTPIVEASKDLIFPRGRVIIPNQPGEALSTYKQEANLAEWWAVGIVNSSWLTFAFLFFSWKTVCFLILLLNLFAPSFYLYNYVGGSIVRYLHS